MSGLQSLRTLTLLLVAVAAAVVAGSNTPRALLSRGIKVVITKIEHLRMRTCKQHFTACYASVQDKISRW